jgi:tape measure domain-containing protein
MSKNLTHLNVGLEGDATGLAKAFSESVGKVSEVAGKFMEIGEKLSEWVGIGAAIEVGREAIDKIGEAIKSGFETADHIENTQAALVGLAGSAENAAAIVAHLKNLASTPPFGFDEVAAASKKLLSAGVSADQIIGIIHNLGDVSVGTGASIESLTEIFARAANGGSVDMRALNQAARQGIPIIQELAKHFGTSREGVEDMAKAGEIGFADLQAAFASMSAEGGKFNGLAESQVNTLGGVYGSLKAQVQFAFADIANAIAEAFDFKGVLEGVKSSIPKITGFITNAIEVAAPYIKAVENYIGQLATNVYNYIAQNWGKIVDWTSTTISEIYNVFSAGFSAISGIFQSLWEAVSLIWTTALNAFGGDTDKSGKAVSRSWGDTARSILDWINLISAGLANWRSGLTAVVADAIAKFATLNEKMTNFSKRAAAAAARAAGVSEERIQATILYDPVSNAKAKRRLDTAEEYNRKHGTNLSFDQLSSQYAKSHPGKDNPYEGRQYRDTEFSDETTAAIDAANKAHEQYENDVAKTLEEQQKNRDKIGKLVDDVLKNGFHAAPLKLPPIKPTDPIVFDAKLNQDNLNLKITPHLETNKLLRYGSGEMGLATYVGPMIKAAQQQHSLFENWDARGASYAAGATPPPMPPPGAGGAGSSPEKMMEKYLEILSRYIVKWDSNPPISAVSF